MPLTTLPVAPRPHVFLSHSSVNKPFVRTLAADLDVNGFDAWADEGEIEVGQSLMHKISDALRDTDYVIAVHTEDFAKSQWAQQEIAAALAGRMSGKIKTVILIRLDNAPIPTILQGHLYADFRSDYDAGLRQILRALTGKRDTPSATAVSLPVDRAKLVAVLDGLTPTSLTRVINRISGAEMTDNTNHLVPERVQSLLRFATSSEGCGLNEVARIVTELFPNTKSKIGPFT